MPYPILWGYSFSYEPVSFIFLMVSVFLAQISGFYLIFIKGFEDLYYTYFTDEYEGMTFMEKSLEMISYSMTAWGVYAFSISVLCTGYNSGTTAAILHSSTFWISAIYYLMYGDIFNQIDFETFNEQNEWIEIRYSLTYGTVYHYIGEHYGTATFTTLIIQHLKDLLLAFSFPLMAFTVPL